MTRTQVEALEKLVKQIQAGSCPMPVLLQGEEDFRVEEARRRVIAAFFPDEAERRDAVETISARDNDLPRIISRASESPLFASRHALVVRDAEVLAKGDAAAGEASPKAPKARPAKGAAAKSSPAGGTWGALPPDAILILIARPGLDRRTRFYREIESTGSALTFARLEDADEITAWIDARARYLKKTVEPAARALLIEKTVTPKEGASLRVLATELEKLALYTGDRAAIRRADVEALVGRSSEEDIFGLTNAISERATGRALELAHVLLARDEPAILLLSLLTREIRMLLEARLLFESEPRVRQVSRMSYGSFRATLLPALIAGATRPGESKPAGALLAGHPYPAYLKLQQADRFRVPQLLGAFRHLAAADRDLKSSGRPERVVIEGLVVQLSRGMA